MTSLPNPVTLIQENSRQAERIRNLNTHLRLVRFLSQLFLNHEDLQMFLDKRKRRSLLRRKEFGLTKAERKLFRDGKTTLLEVVTLLAEVSDRPGEKQTGTGGG